MCSDSSLERTKVASRKYVIGSGISETANSRNGNVSKCDAKWTVDGGQCTEKGHANLGANRQKVSQREVKMALFEPWRFVAR